MKTTSFLPALLAIAAFATAPGAFAQATYINTANQKETPFTTSGTLRPFIEKATSPNYVRQYVKDGEPCARSFWDEDNADGSTAFRGSEAGSTLEIYEEGWMGFQFLLPSGGYPTNKEGAIAQIFTKGADCDNGGTWAALLVIKNNTLILRHRRTNGCTSQVDHVLSSDIQRDAWKTMIMHFRVSRNGTGLLEAWYAGAPKASPTVRVANFNFGDGVWDGDSLDATVANNFVNLKFGQYAFDAANYTNGEQRNVYYDDMSYLKYNPSNAFELVDPR